MDRKTLWKLLRHYRVLEKIITLIRCTYQDMRCSIAPASQESDSFNVKTAVRQGCLLSLFLFLLVINWITTTGRNNRMQCTLLTQLDDLDFADDLTLLSHNYNQMQYKTTPLETTSASTGLKSNRKQTEVRKVNTTANTPVTVGMENQGGTDQDVTARMNKAREVFDALKNISTCKEIRIRT